MVSPKDLQLTKWNPNVIPIKRGGKDLVLEASLYDTDIEKQVISEVLFDNAQFDQCTKLAGQHFYSSFHGKLFDVCRSYYQEHGFVEPELLRPVLETNFDDDLRTGTDYLAQILSDAEYARGRAAKAGYNIPEYRFGLRVGNILDYFHRREGLKFVTAMAKDLADPKKSTAFDWDEMLARHLDKIERPAVNKRFEPVTGAVAADEAVENIENLLKNPDAARGMMSGIETLDKPLRGFHKGHVVLIGGRPSMGKSTLASEIARGVAKNNFGVMFFALEMSRLEITTRMLCAEASATHGSPIAYADALDGTISGDDGLQVAIAGLSMREWPFFIDEEAALTVPQISSKIQRMKLVAANEGQTIDVIVLDQLSTMRGTRANEESRNIELGYIMQELRALAAQHDICVILLHQLNRSVEQRDNKRPQLADLRDSGTIEQDADVVLFVYREEYYLERTKPALSYEIPEWQDNLSEVRHRLEVNVAKQRMGPTDTVTLFSHMASGLIADEDDEFMAAKWLDHD